MMRSTKYPLKTCFYETSLRNPIKRYIHDKSIDLSKKLFTCVIYHETIAKMPPYMYNVRPKRLKLMQFSMPAATTGHESCTNGRYKSRNNFKPFDVLQISAYFRFQQTPHGSARTKYTRFFIIQCSSHSEYSVVLITV